MLKQKWYTPLMLYHINLCLLPVSINKFWCISAANDKNYILVLKSEIMYVVTAYEDEEDVLKLPANHMPYCTDDLSFTVPLCVPDPVDPSKISCYNKALVMHNRTNFLIIMKIVHCV